MIAKLRSNEHLNSALQLCPVLLSYWDSYAPAVKLPAPKHWATGDVYIHRFRTTRHKP